MDLRRPRTFHLPGSSRRQAPHRFFERVGMMKSGKYDLFSLVTHEYKLEQIADALVMGANANKAQKVCISFQSA